MEQHGFIQDMLDVKVLILFVTANAAYPLSQQKIYELCYQDDKLSYFDVSIAVPQMVESGHLTEVEHDQFVISEKGREAESVTEDAIAYPVMCRARAAVERYNQEMQRDRLIKTEIVPHESGEISVKMQLDDEMGRLMNLELIAPSQKQAKVLEQAFHKNADKLFRMIMTELLNEEKDGTKG